jgi:hypothetical protein
MVPRSFSEPHNRGPRPTSWVGRGERCSPNRRIVGRGPVLGLEEPGREDVQLHVVIQVGGSLIAAAFVSFDIVIRRPEH